MERFKIGDRLEAMTWDKVQHGIEYVTITDINEETEIYHWEAPERYFGGKIHSGYRFEDAKRHISKQEKRENTINEIIGEMETERKDLKDRKWYWVLVDGYDWYMPCLFMEDKENPDWCCFLPAGLGDKSSMGIYFDDIEKVGPEIIAPEA